jgi:hypothetical protein
MEVLFPKATTGPGLLRYRGSLLSYLIHVSLIPTSHNMPSVYLIESSATELSSTCKSHSHSPQHASYLSERSSTDHYSACLILISCNRPSNYRLKRRATEYPSTCNSHSHKLQQAKYPSVKEERCSAPFHM